MIQVQADAQSTKELKERAEAQAANMKRIAVIYLDMKDQLYRELQQEFSTDLPRWGAEIDRSDLAVRFKEPEVLFESQKAELRPRFKDILSNFFPRYLRILSNKTFHEAIEEIRIEGHTSSIWVGSPSPDKAYLNNMGLSQERTRSVLQFVLEMSRGPDLQQWLREHLTANGLSSSKLRYNHARMLRRLCSAAAKIMPLMPLNAILSY
jgi:outer membrane protein OmpA-like peptidoglycan-associated protein